MIIFKLKSVNFNAYLIFINIEEYKKIKVA